MTTLSCWMTQLTRGNEERSVLLGVSDRLRVIVVSHTLRDVGNTIRIISARKATKRERAQYFERVMP